MGRIRRLSAWVTAFPIDAAPTQRMGSQPQLGALAFFPAGEFG